jgi:hypothetical protein
VELFHLLLHTGLSRRFPQIFVRDRFRMVRGHLADRICAGQRVGAIAADIDPDDAASLVIASSDGLQLQ